MQRRTSFSLCAVWFFAFSIAAVDGRSAVARELTPEQVLKSSGLTLKERCYVVQEEIRAEALAQKMSKLSAEVAAGMQTAMALESSVLNDNLIAGELGQELAFDRMESRSMGRRGRGMNTQARTVQNQSNAVRRDAQREQTQLNRISGRLSTDARQYQAEAKEFQTLVGTMMKRYDELSRQSEVREALRSLNQGVHPKYALGPIPSYRARIDIEMVRILSAKGLKVHRSVIEPIAETSLVKQVEAVNSLALHLNQAKAPADDPRRAELAKEVASLRKLAATLDQKREEISREPDVIDAVDELNIPVHRKRFHLGLSGGSESARHILKRLDDRT